ncbi:MAG TPA: alcohol dehydrogenase catalytic domain-containing protein [Kribbella sp.]|jgi:alcohol dehydrogenase
MKALVYNGPGQRDWREVPEPTILEPEDAIVRVDAVTICGTDLHILKGDVPTVDSGRVLGHEAVGTVTEVGDGVRGVTPGDRVLISCISSCGRCEYCRESRYGQCLGGGGWILGHRIDGTQAEMVRVPFADRSMYKLPVNVSDDSALLLADILPTAYEVGTLSGRVSPGDTVVIVGAGPIGLSAITTSKLFSPSRVVVVDVAVSRQKAAMEHGADLAIGPDEDVVETVRGFTNGLGANVAIEAVGVPATFELCTQVIRPGGRVANVGVHGAPATLHLEELWFKDVTISTGLVDTSSTPRLLSMLASGRLAMPGLITHRFGLDEMQDAYDVFSRPAETGALKVALFNEESLGQERR